MMIPGGGAEEEVFFFLGSHTRDPVSCPCGAGLSDTWSKGFPIDLLSNVAWELEF